MQIKTRVAGVLAVTTAAVALIGGPAFADNSPSVGNVTGIASQVEDVTAKLLGFGVEMVPVRVHQLLGGFAISIAEHGLRYATVVARESTPDPNVAGGGSGAAPAPAGQGFPV